MSSVIWTCTAKNDLAGIIAYVARDSNKTARNLLKKIRQQVATLSELPEKCRIVPEFNELGVTQYRDMVIAPWRVIYKVKPTEVNILAVLDSRRNVEDILFKRMIGGYL